VLRVLCGDLSPRRFSPAPPKSLASTTAPLRTTRLIRRGCGAGGRRGRAALRLCMRACAATSAASAATGPSFDFLLLRAPFLRPRFRAGRFTLPSRLLLELLQLLLHELAGDGLLLLP